MFASCGTYYPEPRSKCEPRKTVTLACRDRDIDDANPHPSFLHTKGCAAASAPRLPTMATNSKTVFGARLPSIWTIYFSVYPLDNFVYILESRNFHSG